MRRSSLVSALLAVVIGSGLAIAQTTASAPKSPTSAPAGHDRGDGMRAGMKP